MLDSIDHLIIAVEDISSATDSYTKLLGFPPTWKGIHPGQGTENALFPLENLYIELLAAKGEGAGATTVKSFLELNGEGLSGIALGTSDIQEAKKKLAEMEVNAGEIVSGEGADSNSNEIRTWKNLFLPFSLTKYFHVIGLKDIILVILDILDHLDYIQVYKYTRKFHHHFLIKLEYFSFHYL